MAQLAGVMRGGMEALAEAALPELLRVVVISVQVRRVGLGGRSDCEATA